MWTIWDSKIKINNTLINMFIASLYLEILNSSKPEINWFSSSVSGHFIFIKCSGKLNCFFLQRDEEVDSTLCASVMCSCGFVSFFTAVVIGLALKGQFTHYFSSYLYLSV